MITHVGIDLSEEFLSKAKSAGIVAYDSETTGLDSSVDRLCTMQFCAGDEVFIVKDWADSSPAGVIGLFEDPTIIKLGHHISFDLRFLAHEFDVICYNAHCTKLFAKVLNIPRQEQSLKVLLNMIGIELDKSQQRSDWSNQKLTDKQIEYAAFDVLYLVQLEKYLIEKASPIDLQEYARLCSLLPSIAYVEGMNKHHYFEY